MQEIQRTIMKCQSDLPYPPIKACETNLEYANLMLDNLGGPQSEMSAVSLYRYNNLVTCAWDEISEIFNRVSIVEMHHLNIFGKLAMQLGEDPRLWTRNNGCYQYWSPGYNQYPLPLNQLLTNAIQAETAARDKYIHQQSCINNCNIRENLARIAVDEEIHIDIFTCLYQKYCK